MARRGRDMKNIANAVAMGGLWVAAAVTVAVLALILLYVFVNGIGSLSLDFVFTDPEGVAMEGGIWPTIVATVYVTGLAMLIVTPVAILAAVYLAEYARQGRLVTVIRFAADTLASVPSIVMGLFGLSLFVEAMGFGFSMLSGALALAFLMLPIVMRTTEEAIRSVPRYIRWGSYGLGATKWQTVRRSVLPAAAPRIITGIILATGRAVGETAVVIFTMGTMINTPLLPLDPGRSMTVHLYLLAMEGINLPTAYGTALLLAIMILAFNLAARWVVRRNRRMGRR
ncbi:MAG: phosphate ABC transporter permease PstA [Coriobacteriia bacterium]